MLAALRRIAALVRKELLAILSDRSTRIILVMPAIMQTLVFGYAATFDLSHVPYAVLDASRSAAGSRSVGSWVTSARRTPGSDAAASTKRRVVSRRNGATNTALRIARS